MESLNKIVAIFTFLTLIQLLATSSSAVAPSKNCGEKCGNMTISYPFGIQDGCFRPGFNITCNQATGTAFMLPNVEIIDISLSQSQMRVYNWISYSCNYLKGGENSTFNNYLALGISSSPYRISYTRNKFTAVGCQTLVFFLTSDFSKAYTTGCVSTCDNQRIMRNKSTCAGVGCCEAAAIPQGLVVYNTIFDSESVLNKAIWDYSPCSYAFVAEDGFYTFLQSDIVKYNLLGRFDKAPVVLDWSLGDEACKEAKSNKSGNYACVSTSSNCIDSINGPGYTCSCSKGYEGNPYIHDGCTDIDECKNSTLSQCYGNCTNLPGSHSCKCRDGYHGDSSKPAGCKPNSQPNNQLNSLIPTYGIILIGMPSQRGTARPTGGDGGGPSQELVRPVVWLKPKADGSGGFTLEPSNTVLAISRRAYRGRMISCWPKWTLIPDGVKEAIWQDFLGEVDLADSDISVVQRHWNSKIAKNYRETINSIKTAGKKPGWISEAVWDQFVTWWSNEEFVMESERNSANRSRNPVTHRGGSKSFQHHREDLERTRGAPVSYWDVFTHTHALSQADDSGSVSYSWDHDDKARSAYEKFQQARASILNDTERADLTPDEEDVIFESIMDPATRGRRYGFGNQSVKTAQGEYQRAQDKEVIAQLQAQLTALEERNIRHEAETE